MNDMRTIAALPFALVLACAPKPAEVALPPAGLAGAPHGSLAAAGGGAALPTPSAALTTLPGAGRDVMPPSGGTPSSTPLPPGHPPIDSAPAPPSMPAHGAGAASMGNDASQLQLAGTVIETMDVPEYTYMLIKTPLGNEWAAVGKTPIGVGDRVTVTSQLVMDNFTSKSLNRTFPRLVMGILAGPPKKG